MASSIHVLEDAARNAEEDECIEYFRGRAENMQGKNTKKGYDPVIADFKQWCFLKRYKDDATVTANKMLLYLKENVVNRLCIKGKRKGETVGDGKRNLRPKLLILWL